MAEAETEMAVGATGTAGAAATTTETDAEKERETEKLAAGDGDNGSSWSRLSLSQKALSFGLFMCMGSGANWVLASALAQEIPFFQTHLPEKLCIATYMNAATNLGMVFMVLFLLFHYYVRPVPSSVSVPMLLLLSTIGCFLAAAVYPVTAGGVSIMLYLCCTIGGAVGTLASVVMNPFMTSYENVFISAARTGGSTLTLMCAVVAFIQSPGSSHRRFDTSTYMAIFGALLVLPIFAYRHIIVNKLGERESTATAQTEDSEKEIDSEMNIGGENPMFDHNTAQTHPEAQSETHTETKKETKTHARMQSFEVIAPRLSPEEPALLLTSSSSVAEDPSTGPFGTPFDRCFAAFIDWVIPAHYAEKHPWLKITLPYILTVGWVDFNTWGMISAITPFAIAHASLEGSGAYNLSIAYQVAAIALVLGDLSTAVIKLPVFYCLIGFTAFCLTVYSAAISADGFRTPAAAPLIIFIYAAERFLEAHIVTSTYRAIATHIPPEHREAASRAVGICDQVCTTLGTIFSTLMVSLTFSCNSSDDDGN